MGQENIFGEYKEDTTAEIQPPYSLKLNCDGSFLFEYKSSMICGKWVVGKKQNLILKADSGTGIFKTVSRKKRLEYYIRDNHLYGNNKAMSKREYKRTNRLYDRSTGEGHSHEPYTEYKARQEKSFLMNVRPFDCK